MSFKSPILKKAATTAAFLVSMAALINADPWKLDLKSNLTLTMNTYSNNWAGKEVGSLSWALQFTGIAEKQFTPLMLNTNTLKLGFGQTSTQSESSSVWIDKWSKMQKSTDLVDFETLLRFTMKGFIDPFIGVRFISQFYDNSSSTSHYVNPINLTESFGIASDLIAKENVTLKARLAGAARQIIDRYATTDDSVTLSSGGTELVLGFKAKRKDNLLTFTSDLVIYEALLSEIKDNDDWRHPDINWENNLTINVTSFVMISLYLQMLYDKEVDLSPRFKETLSVGLTYNVLYPKAK